MVPIDRLLAERACEQLGFAFARCLDFHDQDALPELFWPGAELITDRAYAPTEVLIAVSGGDRTPTRHLVTNTFVEVTGSDTARGISYLTKVRAGDDLGVVASGHTEDRYERRDGDWRFARRRLHWLP